MFAFLEGAVGDLAQLGAVVVQGADVTPVDLIGAGLEVVIAEGLQALQPDICSTPFKVRRRVPATGLAMARVQLWAPEV